MSILLTALKRALFESRLRRRYPTSLIHPGASADAASSLGRFSVLFKNVRLMDSSLAAYSYVQENSSLYSVDVGPFCSIAANVTIGLINHPTGMVSTSPVFYDSSQPLPRFFARGASPASMSPRTTIGADVWIGEGAKIIAGVNIGEGAVIGASAVVTQDVAPYSVAVGVPCRTLRRRFDEATCERLSASRWWEMADDRLAKLAPLFADPQSFLQAIESAEVS